MLRVIESAATIKKCQTQLRRQVDAVTTEKRRHVVGFPGGTAEAIVYYMEALDFWMTLQPISNRYWNCGGLGYPFASAAPAPQVEINPPLSGIDRRIAGAFLEDEDGVRYIAHNGKIGGGAKGVSKSNFLRYYPAVTLVMSGDLQMPMYVIGRLDDDLLPRQLRDFTRVSAEFRALVKAGKAPVVRLDLQRDDTFAPEFEGTKIYRTADIVEANCTHGMVVKALREHLLAFGIQSFNTVARDLYVPGNDGTMDLLFEVKSTADSTSIYGAVGQLMFHGGAQAARRLVAVLPNDVAPKTAQRISELGIALVTFSFDDDGAPAFEGLDAVVSSIATSPVTGTIVAPPAGSRLVAHDDGRS